MDQSERIEYFELLKDLDQAFRNFNNADPKHIEAAIFQIKVAQCKLDAFIDARR